MKIFENENYRPAGLQSLSDKLAIYPYGRLRPDEMQKQIVRIGRSAGEMRYIPILPHVIADFVVGNDLDPPAQSNAVAEI